MDVVDRVVLVLDGLDLVVVDRVVLVLDGLDLVVVDRVVLVLDGVDLVAVDRVVLVLDGLDQVALDRLVLSHVEYELIVGLVSSLDFIHMVVEVVSVDLRDCCLVMLRQCLPNR